jgi:hypothetical protein
MHKFVEQSWVVIFCNERTRSTPIESQTHILGVFWTVPLLHELRCKMGRTEAINAQVRITKSRRNFPQRTHPIQPIGPQTQVLERFRLFRYCTNFGAKWAKLVINAQIHGTESRWNFSQRTHPIYPTGPQTQVFEHFGSFRYCMNFGA